VAANVDRDVIDPMLNSLLDMVMLTDETGLLTGEEKIRVLGVAVAQQRETQRARQLEFLQITGNPIDMQIIGPKGRAQVLRAVATEIGLPGENIVPSDAELQQQQQMQQMMQMAQMQAGQQQPVAGPPHAGGGAGPAPQQTPVSPQHAPPQSATPHPATPQGRAPRMNLVNQGGPQHVGA
jgi:hypothetical protein